MQYDIADLLIKYKDKNLFDLIVELSSEVQQLDNVNVRLHYKSNRHISAYRFKEYRDYAGDFLFFLNTGLTPFNIGIEGLKFFLPIINNLVDKGQLRQSVLEIFQ